MTTTAAPRTFTAGPNHWERNRRPAHVAPAVITTRAGNTVPGIYIHQSGKWLVLTEEAAIQLANDMLDTIERNAP